MKKNWLIIASVILLVISLVMIAVFWLSDFELNVPLSLYLSPIGFFLVSAICTFVGVIADINPKDRIGLGAILMILNLLGALIYGGFIFAAGLASAFFGG